MTERESVLQEILDHYDPDHPEGGDRALMYARNYAIALHNRRIEQLLEVNPRDFKAYRRDRILEARQKGLPEGSGNIETSEKEK